MNVIRADAMGVCFGVRRALQIADRVHCPESVTILGQLVHNEAVLSDLESRGFRMTAEGDRAAVPSTPQVLITAHGISQVRRQRLEAAGKRLIDTTCPLVRRLHRAAQSLAAEGFFVLVIGRPGHVEVQGIVEDLADYEVCAGPADVRSYPSDRIGIVCQTTTPPRVARAIQWAVRLRNLRAQIRFIDTICRSTRERLEAVQGLLRQVDAMVVVGGRNSNNTRELADLCREHGVTTWHVQSADDLQPSWFDGCWTVGLTAGASTVDAIIDEVHQALCELRTGVVG
jgi:4-hydroxy-3-methylbut-2-enyl diphosphate reductase